SLSLRPEVIELADGRRDDLHTCVIELSNESSNAVHVVGGRVTCGTEFTADFPVTVPGFDFRPLPVEIRFNQKPGLHDAWLQLYCECEGQYFTVSGRFRARIID